MCTVIDLYKKEEMSILTSAYHAFIKNFAQAEQQLQGCAPGTFVTFSVDGKNFCSAVKKDGTIQHKPFRWDVSGGWYNGSPTCYATEMDLLDHLVDGQSPIPLT